MLLFLFKILIYQVMCAFHSDWLKVNWTCKCPFHLWTVGVYIIKTSLSVYLVFGLFYTNTKHVWAVLARDLYICQVKHVSVSALNSRKSVTPLTLTNQYSRMWGYVSSQSKE